MSLDRTPLGTRTRQVAQAVLPWTELHRVRTRNGHPTVFLRDESDATDPLVPGRGLALPLLLHGFHSSLLELPNKLLEVDLRSYCGRIRNRCPRVVVLSQGARTVLEQKPQGLEFTCRTRVMQCRVAIVVMRCRLRSRLASSATPSSSCSTQTQPRQSSC